jgi:hypothetical protein
MKKIIYLILIAALICGCAKNGGNEEEGENSSVTKIHGTVVASGEPINAAAILLTPGGGVKITGSDGMYEFTDLQPGKYELKVFKEDFQSFNTSVDMTQGKDEEVVVTLTRGAGNLSINKTYVDMGSNESNNVAGFSILNTSGTELTWSITNAARWITDVDPTNGIITANSASSVVFTIDRSKLSRNTVENYATLVVRSTNASDGSIAELLVTVFSNGEGTNTTIDSDEDYLILGNLYVQSQDLGGTMDWTSANSACKNSLIGGFDDWSLPNMSEIGVLYAKREAIGGFFSEVINYNELPFTGYWTSEKHEYPNNYYWLRFGDGRQDYAPSEHIFRCRCVRTPSPLPEVSTLYATNVTTNSATLNGRIEKRGESAYTERGFVYSNTFQHPSIDDDDSYKKVVPGTSAEFSANVSELLTDVTYYVRAYATNKNGTAYGESVYFIPGTSPDVAVFRNVNLMVLRQDVGIASNYSMATASCEGTKSGYNDWRLPTLTELSFLYEHSIAIGGFGATAYWSSTICSGISDSPRNQIDFNSGIIFCSNKSAYVRCVRTLE